MLLLKCLSHLKQSYKNKVFEITVEKPVNYGIQENIKDVELLIDFIDPFYGKITKVDGFYYHTRLDGTSLWKARFTTPEIGKWTYSFTLTHLPSGSVDRGMGTF